MYGVVFERQGMHWPSGCSYFSFAVTETAAFLSWWFGLVCMQDGGIVLHAA